MAKEEQQINLRVRDTGQFYANETTINFGPMEFVLDFRCGTHVQDVPNARAVLLTHNVIILTPYHVKSFSEILSKAVKDYESKFGEIKKPDELKKAENIMKKEQKKIDKDNKQNVEENQVYFG